MKKLWREKANMQMSWSSPGAVFRTSGPTKGSNDLKDNYLSNVASEARDTGEGLHGAARHSYAHAQYTQPVY